MNKQRQVIYEERNKILDGKDLVAHVEEVTLDTVQRRVSEFCPEDGDPESWDLKGLSKWMQELAGRTDGPEVNGDMEQGDIVDAIDEYVVSCYHEKSERLSDEIMQQLSAQVMLRVIDTRWMAYLQEMDYLKTGIGLRGFGQRDPLVEYKTEAFAAFTELVNTMYEDFLRTILRIELAVAPQQPQDDGLRGARYSGPEEVDGDHGNRTAPAHLKAAGKGGGAPAPSKPATYRRSEDPDPYVGVGRNDPCPCGSGKKFKNCHGRNR